MLLLICAGLLILALADMPAGYYTFLRLAVTLGAVTAVYAEWKGDFTAWGITFSLLAILFNPLIPIYLYDKSIWMPIDLIAAILFVVRALSPKTDAL